MGKSRFTVVFEGEPEEQLFIATVPALSIEGYGATREEALEKIKEAAEFTIEGLKETGQPVPTGA